MLSERAAPSATQAGARERAWTSDTFSRWQMRASVRTLSSIENGFLVAAGKGIQMPPLACSSPTSRPPSVATSARAPACDQALGDVDGGALRAAGLEFGDDLQDRPARQRMDTGSDGKAVPPPGRAEKLTDVRAFSKRIVQKNSSMNACVRKQLRMS